MHNDDPRRAINNGLAENLAGVNKALVKRAQAYKLFFNKLRGPIKVQHVKMFLQFVFKFRSQGSNVA
jgi:hypothetical protein